MTELSTVRTIADVTQEIRDLQNRTRRIVLGYAIEVGRRLVEAKGMLSHGEWGGWLKDSAEFSERTAQRFMTLYDEYGAAQIGIFGAELNPTALSDLSYTKALALVAVPAEEREEFAVAIDAEHISSRELEQAIRERDAALARAQAADKAKKAAEDEANKLDEERASLDQELRELKARPIDVAVQEPDPEAVKAEVNKALAAADVKHTQERDKILKKLDALEAKRDKLEQAVKAAEAKVEAAKSAGSDETDGLQREVERLKKQIAMSDTTTAQFKILFNNAQGDINSMLELIGAAAPEVALKLCKALSALLSSFTDKLGALQTLRFVPQLVKGPGYIPEDIDDEEDDDE